MAAGVTKGLATRRRSSATTGGQWERPRYAVNWFAKAFLKKSPPRSREPVARRRRTCRCRYRSRGGEGWNVSFWAYTAKITSRQGLYLCYIITPRATGWIEIAGRRRTGRKAGGCGANAQIRGGGMEKKRLEKFFGGWPARASERATPSD